MFKHVISLGWFCSPALEIKRIGYRDSSYPFDWLLSHDFSLIMDLIKSETQFTYCNEDMLQYKDEPAKWYNRRYVISIFHDFSKYEKMVNQLDSVNQKYHRRFERFYSAIKEPTLFIRYIKDVDEAAYIVEHEKDIVDILQGFNQQNKIVFVANRELENQITIIKEKVYIVDKDENDYVARTFFEKAPELENYICQYAQKPLTTTVSKRRSNSKLNSLINKFKKEAINESPIHVEGILERLPIE